ncbi:MAG: uracil-DNA glycosylase [Candidatus Obscuribacterales bacterium]|nr:uracil-DNA glycosylase [Candidatus Obscuribacterales bacterium]
MSDIKSGARFESLAQAELTAITCTECSLCKNRTNVVFARGNPEAKLMLIGDGPGSSDDSSGKPFTGRAGLLLDRILESVNIDLEKDIYLCNIVKCRPPENRLPARDEIKSCRQYIDAQLEFVKPKLILLAGSTAMQAILQVKEPISRVRGKWFNFENDARVMAVFHPSYLLRNDSKEVGSPKWLMWQDIKAVRLALDNLH